MDIKKNISQNSFFYKLYLYYNLYIRHKALKKKFTYSQHKDDLFINSYFKDKDKGFYLDVGCYHPIMYSNTALLHNRGWQGVNIDMNQTSIDLFNILRKKDKNICAAISNKRQETIQYFDHAFSPINSLDKKFSDIASKTISFNHHTEKKINTYTFDQIAQMHNIEVRQIDFINIDVEAHDFEVLEGMNLSLFDAKMICIELTNNYNNQEDKKFRDYLSKYNYSLIKKIGLNGFFELQN
jgi:FkbM family methyltransferase